jgi:serine/threonine-protein kinase
VREAIESVSMSGREAEQPAPRESRAVIDDRSVDNWLAAYRSKLKGQDAIALGLCLAGVVYIALSVPGTTPRNFGLVAVTGIAVCIALRAWLIRGQPHRVVSWPWDVIGILSAGPAYAIGIHSGFATIVATGLFMTGLFETGTRNRWWIPVACVCGAHGVMFALIASGVVPDTSNIRLWTADTTPWDPYLQHAIVQVIYLTSYFAGRLLDRRFVEVYERARVAFRAVARADARLRVARAELDAAQGFGEGLFTGTEVGPYRVGELLGRGGMGEVYAATHTDGTKVALKLMRADRLADPAAQERFEREAKLLLQISSAHTARVLDVGRDNELPYLAMEHVEGPPLSRVLRERELTPTEIVALVSDVARGIADIHKSGVVHRDIKPSNLLHGAIVRTVGPGGRRWQIVDFGVSVLAGSEDRSPAGTPQYMSPEHALGEATDARSDLYSFGLVLYRVISGRPAFVGTDRRAIALAARDRGPPDPRDAGAIDEDLVLVLRIALAADPAERFAAADELREAFVGALTGRLDERTRARGRELLARRPWAT